MSASSSSTGSTTVRPPIAAPRCEHRFPTSHYHQCRSVSVTTCELCDRAVRPATACRPFVYMITQHIHVWYTWVLCIASPSVHTPSRWPSVSYHTYMCNTVMILYRAQMCDRHISYRLYAYHFAMICDKCWEEDRYMHCTLYIAMSDHAIYNHTHHICIPP